MRGNNTTLNRGETEAGKIWLNVVNAILSAPTVMLWVCLDSAVQVWGDTGRAAGLQPTHMTILCHLSFWVAMKKKDESCSRHEALSPIPAASG